MRVLINNNLLRGFIRRAKTVYPREYIELLYGRESRDRFHVTALFEPEQRSKARSVTWIEDADAETLDDTPRSPILLGTIHSHPKESDASPSEFDWKRQASSGDRIAGICALWRGADDSQPLKSKVRFYRADAMLTAHKD